MMNTILLSFAIVITLVNLALALSTFGYIVEMNKHMDEWFKMFKTLTEACSGLCEENGNVITSLMKHIEYTEKEFAEKEKEVQELNDKYNKLYEEFKNLEKKLDERAYHYIKNAINSIGTEEDFRVYYNDEIEDIGDQDGDEEFEEFIKKIRIPIKVEGTASAVPSNAEDGGQNGNSNNTYYYVVGPSFLW